MISGNSINTGIIRTNDNCKGCNKCISACPVLSANVAVNVDGASKIYVDQSRCLLCGKCMDVCTHDARVFEDDTERFFSDLRKSKLSNNGKKISLIVAPSFPINYPTKFPKILGYLQSLGVNKIYSVSTGADITVWGYMNYIEKSSQKGMISQPCAAIVNYIEKYKPQLLSRVVPVQSPIMCTAIYLKKYLGITDDIAFISPCIAKKQEIEREENKGLINYNVTYAHLLQAIGDEDISSYQADDFELEYGMGAMFATQGGLRENAEYYLGLDGETFVNQKEGEIHAYAYLNLYDAKIEFDDPYRAWLIDILNCARGCNYGTATEFKYTSSNHIPYFTNKMRVEKSRRTKSERNGNLNTPEERMKDLNQRFENLNLLDFITTYKDRHVVEKTVTKAELEKVYLKLLKHTEAERAVDCTGCGYHTCQGMATAIARGYNFPENCVAYIKKKLLIEHSESVMQKQKLKLLEDAKSNGKLANLDQLTGLTNRSGFEEGLGRALTKARKTGLLGFVYSIDLDDFLLINDSYGHSCGNSLLIEFAGFLRESFGEIASICRIGGDEFALIMEESDEYTAQNVTTNILQRAQRAWNAMGHRFYCTVSIGIARFPEVDDGVNDLIKKADLAMYKAKKLGKNNCVMYDRQMDAENHEQIHLIRQMRDAVANKFRNFEVLYQPWMSLEGEIIGVEALLRWKDDMGKSISPSDFIPLAESVGLIIPIGEMVLERAALQCKKINEIHPGFRVSVNVSGKQFNSSDVYEKFMGILKRTDVNLNNIVLEITESLGVESISRQKTIFEKFINNGIKIALDDFGTGYSSLSYLNELPLDLVKIDRSFIEHIDSDTFSQSLLFSISDLMHHTGRMVCVEGVETSMQIQYCKRAKIDIIQGYYYYRPMSSHDIEKLVEELTGKVLGREVLV